MATGDSIEGTSFAAGGHRASDGRVFSWCRRSDAICQTLGGKRAHKLYAGPEPHHPAADHAEADEAAARIVERLTEVGEPPELSARTYPVSGACAGGDCLLGEWSGPGTGAFRLLGAAREGQQVAVVCQTTGETARAADGTESAIWDRLSTGNFVSDLYLSTPGVGAILTAAEALPAAGGERLLRGEPQMTTTSTTARSDGDG